MTELSKLEEIFLPALKLIESGNLLSRNFSNEKCDYPFSVVNHFDDAIRHAWRVDDSLVEIWTDLREKHAAKLPDILNAYDFWSDKYEPLTESCVQTTQLDEDIVSDIEADLFHCCMNIHTKLNNPLWNQVFYFYKKGVWPCGWTKNEFLNGEIVIFY